MMNFLMGVYTIWLRDLLRFFRDRARIIGSIAQPSLYLFVLGTGLSSTLGEEQASGYIRFIYPGIIAMTLLFTSVFSSISIIWDREFGFLKEVLVAPVSRAAVAVGKSLGGASVATLQGTMMLIFAPFVGYEIGFLFIIQLIPLMLLISFSLTSMGVLVAARMRSMEGFQVIMNFILMPMFFLSGAMFPLKGLPSWLSYLTRFDPLTYGVDALRNLFTKINHSDSIIISNGAGNDTLRGVLQARVELFKPINTLAFDLTVITVFGIIMIALAMKQFEKTE